MVGSHSQLWFCKSKVLRGFYQSQVVVVATGKEAAIDKAMEALDAYIDERLDDMWYVSLDANPDDPSAEWVTISMDDEPKEAAAARHQAREAFRAELSKSITPIESGHLLQVSS